MTYRSLRSQNGSVLFVILIAVALFGALGYAVANMMNGGGSTDISKEKAAIYAGEILDYARSVRQTVQELRISNGCSDAEISFENDIISGYENLNAPNDFSCHVFHPDGGAMQPYSNLITYLEEEDSGEINYGIMAYTGDVQVVGVGNDCGADSCNDLILIFSYLNSDICAAINETIGSLDYSVNENISGVDPRDDNYFTGSYSYLATRIIGDDETDFSGSAFGCMQRSFSNGGTFYQVLIAR